MRFKKLTSKFFHTNIDALLVTGSPNISYLTQFPSEDSWLLVTRQKSFYITDSRYVLAAQKGLKHCRGVVVHCYAGSMGKTVFALAKKMRVKRLGLEEAHLTVAQYRGLKRQTPKGISLVGTQDLVENLRELKDAKEMSKIRKALQLHAKALRWLKQQIKPGRSERQIVLKLEQFVKSQGAGFSFPPIVASGPNSCLPHAKVTNRKFCRNDIVLVDFGIDVNGYKSDLTRMFFLGRIRPLIKHVNDCVRKANIKAIIKIKAGVPIAEVDQEARQFLANQKLAKFFGHALGHGVGLEIHESPRLSSQNSGLLKEGMVVTIEPAVYIPNQFGIRIEDMVLVKKTKGEVLSADIP